MPQHKSIDEVITALGNIIREAECNNDTSGYFAALYRKVTIRVKAGIENDFFDDGPRMEKLVVVFASRYLDAYYAFKNNEPVSRSWMCAFEISKKYRPIVLQHLLMGMNAHINFDLGIAAAEISKNKEINDLENDFNKINEILASLVNEVQYNLAKIWPRLKWILKITMKVDDFLVHFSMQKTRKGAWKFAKRIAENSNGDLNTLLVKRDIKVAEKANIIRHPGIIAGIIFLMIRPAERGSVKQKICKLKRINNG